MHKAMFYLLFTILYINSINTYTSHNISQNTLSTIDLEDDLSRFNSEDTRAVKKRRGEDCIVARTTRTYDENQAISQPLTLDERQAVKIAFYGQHKKLITNFQKVFKNTLLKAHEYIYSQNDGSICINLNLAINRTNELRLQKEYTREQLIQWGLLKPEAQLIPKPEAQLITGIEKLQINQVKQ